MLQERRLQHRTNQSRCAVERILRDQALESALGQLGQLQGETQGSPEFLTVQEEDTLALFMMLRIQLLCKQMQLPSFVAAAALSFYKRFYWRSSAMEHDPRLLMPSMLLLAIKSEMDEPTQAMEAVSSLEQWIQQGKLGQDAKDALTRERIAEQELILIRKLDFDFWTHRAYDSLYGCFLRLQHVLPSPSEAMLAGPFDQAISLLQLASLTDLELFMSWHHIVIGIFIYCCKNIAIGSLLEATVIKSSADLECRMDSGSWQRLSGVVMHFIHSVPKLDRQETAKIEQKLVNCLSPRYQPKSLLYQRCAELKEASRSRQQHNVEDPFQSKPLMH